MQKVQKRVGTKNQIINVLRELNSKYGDIIKGCTIINERGLIVETIGLDKYMTNAMAAMTALLSETAERVTNNLGVNKPQIITIRTGQSMIITVGFSVYNQQFRVGALVNPTKKSRWSFFLSRATEENVLLRLASRIKGILERK